MPILRPLPAFLAFICVKKKQVHPIAQTFQPQALRSGHTRHGRRALTALAAFVGAALENLVIRNGFARGRASFAYLAASATRRDMGVRSAQHRVSGDLADIGATEQRGDMVRFCMRTAAQ